MNVKPWGIHIAAPLVEGLQIDFPPLEQFSNRMLGILWAGHHAAGGARMRRDALCAYVMKLLDATP